MRTIRSTKYAAALCALVWLSGFSTRCKGGDETDLAPLHSFVNSLPVHKVGFSKDGAALACFCNHEGFPNFGEVYLWDIQTGKQLRRIKPSFPHSFVAEPYARLCSWTPTGLEVQDDLATSAKRAIRLSLLEGAEIEPGGVYFSMDDKYLAAVRKDDKSVRVWEVRSGDQLRRFALPDISTAEVRSLAFDPANRHLAVGIDTARRAAGHGAVIVWDLKTGQEVLRTDEPFRVFQVAFFANGDLVCGGGNGALTSGTVVVRDAEDLDDARTMHAPSGVWSMAIVPHVGLFTGDSRGQVLLWSIETGKLLAVAKGDGRQVAALAVGRNGRLLASGDWDSVARLWKVAGVQPAK